jgi:hypothetical protein
MPMNNRILRPLASGVHPEAAAWRSAVVANGGSVSASTIKAVSDFCSAIDSAGIRSKIWRLSLLCGSDLNAALVPLYRGPSRTGTQYGNTTDTNNGPFVSGDYAETGASGGLKSNGTSKHLDTGFEQSNIALSDIHLSASVRDLEDSFSGERTLLGIFDSNQTDFISLRQALTTGNIEFLAATFGGAAVSVAGASSHSHVMGVRSSITFAALYQSGTESATQTASVGSVATSSRAYFVFARNNNGTANNRTAARIRMYSIGQAIDATGAAAFAAAVAAFNTTLSRT